MVENPYEKSLTNVNNSIFGRIKCFFRNLFNKNKLEKNIVTENVIEERNIQADNGNYIENIKIPVKKINLRLQKMSKDLESGKIIEEDLCEQELQELREYYIQQIEVKKQSIENYKNRIVKIKAQLI
ncbi:MAG: hypothetical protein IKG42_06715 [Clostridia bacterium]|nr:hypothetical protein [Clostridia bacterium]